MLELYVCRWFILAILYNYCSQPQIKTPYRHSTFISKVGCMGIRAWVGEYYSGTYCYYEYTGPVLISMHTREFLRDQFSRSSDLGYFCGCGSLTYTCTYKLQIGTKAFPCFSTVHVYMKGGKAWTHKAGKTGIIGYFPYSPSWAQNCHCKSKKIWRFSMGSPHMHCLWIRAGAEADYQTTKISSYMVISSKIHNYHWYNNIIPSLENPSCLQTTEASLLSHKSSQTVPHSSLLQISTRPSDEFDPPTSRIAFWHDWPIRKVQFR